MSAGARLVQHRLMLATEKLQGVHRQTFSRVRECISITWCALCRCFQFGSPCRARSRKWTSVLLLPGCCSHNTSDSRVNVVTRVYKSVAPRTCCKSCIWRALQCICVSIHAWHLTWRADGNWHDIIRLTTAIMLTMLCCTDVRTKVCSIALLRKVVYW